SHSIVPTGNLKVFVDISAANGVDKVEFYLNDEKKFFSIIAPYTGYINLTRVGEPGSLNLIVAKVIDKMGYSSQSAVEVKISSGSEAEAESGDSADSSAEAEAESTDEALSLEIL
ncbi:Ig-like domain-containing protein, partial [Candidatus Peregrinibacteria bacterium]|nr:Ig-like domain-containing protein [Candidatus Peregrinibacteria bacterium]